MLLFQVKRAGLRPPPVGLAWALFILSNYYRGSRPVDDWTKSYYMRELINQAEAATLACEDLNAALNARGEVPRAFASVQSLLAAGAMISKMLWPQPSKIDGNGKALDAAGEERRQRTILRGKALRDALGIKGIPILESRKVRNAIEHFDDRLDRHFEAGHRFVVDRNIGPRDQMIVIDGQVPLPLRLIDNSAMTVSVLDDEVPMQKLFDAISEVSRGATEWLNEYDRN